MNKKLLFGSVLGLVLLASVVIATNEIQTFPGTEAESVWGDSADIVSLNRCTPPDCTAEVRTWKTTYTFDMTGVDDVTLEVRSDGRVCVGTECHEFGR